MGRSLCQISQSENDVFSWRFPRLMGLIRLGQTSKSKAVGPDGFASPMSWANLG
jgi:hypothetical protein